MIAQSKWYTVELSVNGGYISWSVTDKTTGTVVQTGSYNDPSPIVSQTASVALFGAGQNTNYTYFDNFSVARNLDTAPKCDIIRDTLTVKFSPSTIENIEDIEKLQIMVAYYEADTNKLLSIDIKEVTNLTSFVAEEFDVNINCDYAKVYLWNGEIASALPAHESLQVEYEPVIDIDTSRYKSNFETIKSNWATNANDSKTTVFIGDSYMTSSFWTNFSTTYSGKDVSLSGIGGSTTSDWLPCIDEVFGDVAPKNVVMHLGTNDFYDAASSSTTVIANVRGICEIIHKMYPEANIYYFGITQRNNTTYASPVDTTNSSIKSWCNTVDYVTFVDTTAKITSSMMKTDGVHMNTSGYAVFVSELEKSGCVIENK